MDQTRPRKSKKVKSADRNGVCCVCGWEQINQQERFRTCSGCKEKLGTRRYYCSRTCQKTDWKTHREVCGSQDFWEYPHKPLLASEADFDRPAALRCQLALIDFAPDVLYHIAPATDDPIRFTLKDKMLGVSFRRVRDKAFATCDLEAIAIVAEVLVMAGGPTCEETVYRQLEEEYDVPRADLAELVQELVEGQTLDPLGRSALMCVHQDNMTKHPSDFWKALARPLD
ncbi:hypothetical protein C8F04DRAFT_1144559 [Mycena alexandri]|uniref:MYND-type domain-containing protein n=1 Tax=Mycena alexandri TaxID=1745969 RepID=A0AAD6S3R9_9AGAR|nr:hypothetical protein C8F04DRAFT_1144559 [Mycena alexandri]